MKISLMTGIQLPKRVSFQSKNIAEVQPAKNDLIQDDVSKNFTFKISNDGLHTGQILSGKSVITGKNYGEEYEIHRDSSLKKGMNISGRIGNKVIDIKSQKKGVFSNKTYIEGTVGDKQVKLIEKESIYGKTLTGKFGENDINILHQHFRHNDMITGSGINMQLMYYLNSNPKFVGTYNQDRDLLPVLAALWRYM